MTWQPPPVRVDENALGIPGGVFNVHFPSADVIAILGVMITEAQKKRLEELEPTYTSRINLSDRSATLVTGATQVGKSTMIGDAVTIAHASGYNSPENSIEEVDTRTTRKERDNDPPGYLTAKHGITHAWMMDRIERGELVQWALFETGDIYATDESSYKGRHNLLPTQVKAIPMLARASFSNINLISVVRPADEWRACFPAIITEQSHVDRLEEAKVSLDFGMYNLMPGIIRVVNYPDIERRAKTAEALVRIVRSDPENYESTMLPDYHEKEYEAHNRAMWEEADRMIKEARVEA